MTEEELADYVAMDARIFVRALRDPIGGDTEFLLSEGQATSLLRSREDALAKSSGRWPQTPEGWSADDLFIVTAAFRYALPRASYAPGLVADWIEARKSTLPAETLAQIATEIRDECARNKNVAVEGRSFLPIPYADRWLKLAGRLDERLPVRSADDRRKALRWGRPHA